MAVALREAPDPGHVLSKALCRASAQLELSGRELARLLGVSEATTSRLFAEQYLVDPASKAGELALLLLRAFRSLDTLLGGDSQKVKTWWRAPNSHLRGVPAERAQSVAGLVDVVNYLDAMRGKL